MLTPDLNYFQVVWLEYVLYWFLHGTVLLAPIVLVWGLGYRPTWRGFGAAYGALVAWAGIALLVNTLTGANYGYLAHAPAGPSLLDVMGPWPWYVVVEIAVIALVWAGITWPWTRSAARSRAPIADRNGTVRRVPIGEAPAGTDAVAMISPAARPGRVGPGRPPRS